MEFYLMENQFFPLTLNLGALQKCKFLNGHQWLELSSWCLIYNRFLPTENTWHQHFKKKKKLGILNQAVTQMIDVWDKKWGNIWGHGVLSLTVLKDRFRYVCVNFALQGKETVRLHLCRALQTKVPGVRQIKRNK